MLDNRTIRNALTNRVPEVYFVFPPQQGWRKTYIAFLVKINGKPYKMTADMPTTALVSHKELITTMVSEVYDEVKKIKAGAISPPLFPGEEEFPPLTYEDLQPMQFKEIEDMLSTKPELLL